MKNFINGQECPEHKNINEYDQIANTIHAQGYEEQLSNFLCAMLRYMQNERWRGACHAACSIMYVALSELGYHVKLCVGEVKTQTICFDHSWILLDGKVIDLAVSLTVIGGKPVSAPVILDMDIGTAHKSALQYGIYRSGLDRETDAMRNLPFVEYMDNYPKVTNGLWGVLAAVFPQEIDIGSLRERYKEVKRDYICKNI